MANNIYLHLLFLLLMISIFGSYLNSEKIIKTSVGKVKGKTLKLSGGKVTEYLGIPFAHPPTGLYRFRGPVELKKPEWNGTLNARRLANSCIQYVNNINFSGYDYLNPTNNISEDCLQLNMWVPKKRTGSVIVFLFGGSYNFGSPSLDIYNGSILALKTKSIVVNLNYRLGIFGFGYLGDDSDVKGNMGFLDQQVGLKWVYKNIRAFGGNPFKVTLFGQSAGAASVTAHLFSETSRSYFKKVIVCSGVITNIWATVSRDIAKNNILEVSKMLFCRGNNSEKLLECLQKADADILLLTSLIVKHPKQPPLNVPFLPIDNDTVFFNGSVSQKIMNNKIKSNADIMIGRTFDEGTYFMPLFLEQFGCKFDPTKEINSKENRCLLNETVFTHFVKMVADMIGLNEEQTKSLEEVYSKVKTNKTRGKITELLSDFLLDCDSSSFAKWYYNRTQRNVYFFEFRKRSPINPWPKWMGAMHGYELEYFFGYPFRHPEKYPKEKINEEKKFSEKLMNYIKLFVNSKNLGKGWNKFNETLKKALVIDENFSKKDESKYVNAISKTCKGFFEMYFKIFK